jgi:hypothetical protein
LKNVILTSCESAAEVLGLKVKWGTFYLSFVMLFVMQNIDNAKEACVSFCEQSATPK